MKKGLLALLLAGCMALTGCEAMLERSFEATAAHVDRPATAEDSSILRVENYRELVAAVLYLVNQGQEEGAIQLHNYAGEVDSDLTAACLEVAKEDPLGAYAVDYIRHTSSRVVSYDQASVSIHYRRTPEQIRSMVNVTGSSAIRTELQGALSRFAEEIVLRVAYCAEDEQSIAGLIRQAYYDTPLAALGMPETEITLYPDSGSQRVVEIVLHYPEDTEQLWRKSEELALRAERLSILLQGLEPQAVALRIKAELNGQEIYTARGAPTAYGALVEGAANAEGMALACTLLCRQAGLNVETVEGTYREERWFWNVFEFSDAERLYMDSVIEGGQLYTAGEMVQAGYQWPDAPQQEELAEKEDSRQ